MSEEKKILVPNIGDFKNVEVIEVLVKSGQEIKKNDPLITLESDKSSVEVPSTYDGKAGPAHDLTNWHEVAICTRVIRRSHET